MKSLYYFLKRLLKSYFGQLSLYYQDDRAAEYLHSCLPDNLDDELMMQVVYFVSCQRKIDVPSLFEAYHRCYGVDLSGGYISDGMYLGSEDILGLDDDEEYDD